MHIVFWSHSPSVSSLVLLSYWYSPFSQLVFIPLSCLFFFFFCDPRSLIWIAYRSTGNLPEATENNVSLSPTTINSYKFLGLGETLHSLSSSKSLITSWRPYDNHPCFAKWTWYPISFHSKYLCSCSQISVIFSFCQKWYKVNGLLFCRSCTQSHSCREFKDGMLRRQHPTARHHLHWLWYSFCLIFCNVLWALLVVI